MKLPSNGTILAPASLHLPLYNLLCQQHGDMAGLQVLSLDAYTAQFSGREAPDLLLQAGRLLRTIPESNTFFMSLQDASFLEACIRLLRNARLAGLTAFPDRTRKEQDLKAILDALAPLKLVQEAQRQFVDSHDFSDVWILPVMQREGSMELEKRMLEGHARLLTQTGTQTKTFQSCANIRKCLEAAANDMAVRGLDASDVLVALADPSWTWVLEQVFRARDIPFTLLHPRSASTIGKEFGAVLRWLQERNQETWTHMVKTLWPHSVRDVLDYHSLFGYEADLSAMEYEENTIVGPLQFARWQFLEQRAGKWLEEHSFVQDWSLEDLEAIASAIQKLHPSPTEEDLAVFDQAVELISLADPDQLPLLITLVEGLQSPPRPDTLSGAAVGGLEDISGLHKEVYLVGAHAGLFPGLKVWSGIFDESYAQDAGFPSLADRLQAQRDNLYRALSQPAALHVYVPQSDYMGKSLESSFELEQFMGGKPRFVPVADKSVWRSPAFSAKVQPLTGQPAAGTLRMYEKCPLRQHLRQSLQLKPEREPELQMNRRTVETLLKRMEAGPGQDAQALLRQEYAFALKLFPQHKPLFEARIWQEAAVLEDLVTRLDIYRNRMHLDWLNEEYQARTEKWQGSLRAGSGQSLPLVLEKDGRTVAAADLSLHAGPEDWPWQSVSYRTKNPELRQESEAERSMTVLTAACEEAVWAQDLDDGSARMKKKPSFAQKAEQMEKALESFLENRESIQPVHEEGACQYCDYRRICRNASRQKGED